MNENRDEEEQLRSVTLQNAQSIFRARQRAEEELVRAKEALWKQSEWLRVTLASIGDAVITTDTEGRVLTLNGVAEGLTGWTQAEAQGRPLSEVFRIVNEETRQPVEDPSGVALRQGRVVGLANHTVLIARDGAETPIDDSAAPIRDDQGRVHGVVLIFRSIAERRRAEEALARLAAIVESSQDAIISKTPDGRIVSWNSGAEQLFGYRADEVVGQSILRIIPPELHDEERTILERLRRGERVEHYETVRATKDGRRLDVSLTISPVRDGAGRVIGASKISRDITEQKRVRVAGALLAAIIDSSDDAIISKDLNGVITSWNKGAERLFGYTVAEAVGRSITLLIPPERLDEEPRILERLRRGEQVDHFETIRVRKDGSRLHISLTISPVKDARGRIVGASKIARDITDRKRAEQRLAAQNGVTRSLAESAGLREAAPKILRAVCEHLEWQVGALWYVDEREDALRCTETYHPPGVQVPRFEAASRARTFARGAGLPGRVWAEGTAVWVPDVGEDGGFARAAGAAAERLHGALGFPITLDRAVLGVMEFFSHDIRQPDGELLQMMTAVGSQVGQFIERRRAEEALRAAHDELERRVAERTGELALANEALRAEVAGHKQAEEARKALLQRLVTAQEEERRRIARELHDEMGQHLTALLLGLQALKAAAPEPSPDRTRLQGLQDLTNLIGQEVHRLALELRPTALDDLGLHTTLVNYTEEWSGRSGVEVDFHSTGLDARRLPPPMETTLFRIVQEALTNVLKHAQARRVSLVLQCFENEVSAIIEDDGRGFDAEAVLNAASDMGRLGLLGMQERVALVGGMLTLESTPEKGTTIFVRIPLPADGKEGGDDEAARLPGG